MHLQLTKLSLRSRVALLFALLGLVVSACLALVAAHFSDSYVHRLIEEMLRVEGEYLRERYADDGRTPHPHTQHFYVYASDAGGKNAPPAALTALEPGLYEIDDHGERHIAVYAVNGQKLYVVLDIGLEGVRERRLARDLIALVLFGTALSAWLGWFWAGRAIEPVRRLAQQVEVLEPSRGSVALASKFARDEVGALAHAFDRYQEKLYEYVRRERAFTADASHELRTPLAVIRGAIEVMMDHGSADPSTAKRLRRMQRGADELRDLLDALLVLARSDEMQTDSEAGADLDAVIDSVLNDRADQLSERQLTVLRHRDGAAHVGAPQKVLSVVIGNLLRSVIQFAEGGALQVASSPKDLLICHEQPGTTAQGDSASSDPALDTCAHALGLGMIRRVCERWQWTLEETVSTGGGRAYVLRFG